MSQYNFSTARIRASEGVRILGLACTSKHNCKQQYARKIWVHRPFREAPPTTTERDMLQAGKTRGMEVQGCCGFESFGLLWTACFCYLGHL